MVHPVEACHSHAKNTHILRLIKYARDREDKSSGCWREKRSIIYTSTLNSSNVFILQPVY